MIALKWRSEPVVCSNTRGCNILKYALVDILARLHAAEPAAIDLDAVRPWLWDRARDATGAMTGKLEALAAHARRGVPCLITQGRRDATDLRHLMDPPAAWPAGLPRTLIALGPEPGDLRTPRGGNTMTDAAAPPDAPDRLVLLNPGPVNVHERVRAALAGPDECHREPEAARLFAAVAGNGRVEERITVLGPPSEGVMYHQIGALRPNKDHHVIRDILAWMNAFLPHEAALAAGTEN